MSCCYYISCRRLTKPIIAPNRGKNDRITCNHAHFKTKVLARASSAPEFGAHIRNRTSLVPAMTSQVNGNMEIVDVAATPYRYHCLWVEALLLKEAYP